MRIERVELTAYGAFTGRSVALSPGLTVVCGPNETGKTTLVSALGDLLWDLPVRNHPYGFALRQNQLRITAVIDGATVVASSRGLHDRAGEPVAPWWRSGRISTRGQWETAYGLTLARIRAGGAAVLADGGDLADLLFRARTGLDLSAEIERLSARSDTLYKRHAGARSVAVRVAAAAVAQARAATEAATSSAGTVETLRREAERRAAEAVVADRSYAAASVALSSAEEARAAWGPARDLVAARVRALAAHASGPVLPTEALAAYSAAETAVLTLEGRRATTQGRLATLTDRLGQYPVDDALLALVDRVEQAQGRLALVRSQQDSLAAHAGALVTTHAQMRDLTRRLDPSSLSASDALAAARALLRPDDVLDRLDRAAADADDARERHATGLASLADAERELARLAALATPTLDVAPARAAREQAWDAVRTPWLSGALPEHDERARLADALEHAVTEADDAADDATARGKAAGERAAAERVLEAARAQEAERASAYRAAQEQWTEIARAAGLPAVVDHAGWRIRRELLDGLADALARHDDLERQRAAADLEVAAFAEEIGALAAEADVPGTDPYALLETLRSLVAGSASNRRTAQELSAQIEELRRALDVIAAVLKGHRAVLASVGADDVERAAVVERTRDLAEAVGDERAALALVRAAARQGTDVEVLVARVAEQSEDELDVAITGAERDKQTQFDLRDLAHSASQDAERALRVAQQDGDAAGLAARESELTGALVELVQEYVETRVMCLALERLRDATSTARDDALVRHASHLAARLTGRRVTGLSVVEDAGVPGLRIEGAGFERGDYRELSEGTADQVFLALRLAGIRQQQESSRAAGTPCLPVILDDVLQAHDDERTAWALEVLAEEARDQQIVLLTHHDAVAAAAQDMASAVVRLDPLPAPNDLGGLAPAPDPAAVRAWLRENGFAVGAKGRISASLLAAFDARHLPDVALGDED